MKISNRIFIIILSTMCFLFFSLSIIYFTEKNSNLTFYISLTGSDTNPGTKDEPFATLEAARDAIRAIGDKDKSKLESITVYLRGGNYYRTESFNLENKDSGNAKSPITYKPYKKEKVIISGAINIDNSKLTKVKDTNILNIVIDKNARNNIFKYDLRLNGINYGDIKQSITGAPELFFNDDPLTMARWPKDNFDLTGKIISNKPSQYTFQFNDLRPLSWTNAKDAWLFGYWYYNWADSIVKMNTIDMKNQYINFNHNVSYGIKETQRYYAFNLLEEISKPGDWYLDRENGAIYIYPPSTNNKNEIYISQLTSPFISMKNTSYLTFEALTFQGGRNTAITIDDGQYNTIADCNIKNISNNAVTINGGAYNGVQSCNIYNTGAGGIYINGGDRNTLTAAHNYADNNEIYNYSRINRTTTAIRLSGVGNRASHNKIHDAPHTAIVFGGNDHIIEYNEIYSVAAETDDVGAIYTGRDWTFRGNILRYNYIHNIESSLGKFGKYGIYLDDCMSSAEVTGNIFFKVDRALMIGGGRDHKISNNLIVNCKDSIYFDERSTWNLDTLYSNLKNVPYQNDVWRSHYPDLYNILEGSSPGNPVGNNVTNNALYMTSEPSIASPVTKYGTVSNNILSKQTYSFMNKDTLDLKELSNLPISISEFQKIPYSKIGLYKDRYR